MGGEVGVSNQGVLYELALGIQLSLDVTVSIQRTPTLTYLQVSTPHLPPGGSTRAFDTVGVFED